MIWDSRCDILKVIRKVVSDEGRSVLEKQNKAKKQKEDSQSQMLGV